MKQVLRHVALLLAGLSIALAQVSTGTITGYVHDSSEAAIVGAKVTINQLATAERRETVTNERGEFTAPYLRRGEYSRWFRDAIHSDELAEEAEAVEREPAISAAESRSRIRQAIVRRYTIPA